MNAKVALFAVLTMFAPAALMGCAAADVRSDDAPETDTESSQEALAAGIQTANLYASRLGLGAAQGADQASPVKTFNYAKGNIKFNTFTGTILSATINGETLSQDIIDIAAILKLGAFVRSEGAAGSTYYDFGGNYVRVTNENGQLSEVGIGATSIRPEAALAAVRSRLGTFVSKTESGSIATAKFTAGTVTYNAVSGNLEDVTLPGIAGATSTAATKLGLGAYVRGTHERGIDHDTYAKGTVHFNTLTGKIISVAVNNAHALPGYVVDLAVNLKLGTFIGSDAATGTAYEEFQNGLITWNSHDNVLRNVETKIAGQLVSLPLPVANAASANAFGSPTSVEGAAGSAYYTFIDGVVRWSNVTQSLAEVTLR